MSISLHNIHFAAHCELAGCEAWRAPGRQISSLPRLIFQQQLQSTTTALQQAHGDRYVSGDSFDLGEVA